VSAVGSLFLAVRILSTSAVMSIYSCLYLGTGKVDRVLVFIFGKAFLWLFVTLYAKSTDKMPRQHTSNPKITKVSKAIASPFY